MRLQVDGYHPALLILVLVLFCFSRLSHALACSFTLLLSLLFLLFINLVLVVARWFSSLLMLPPRFSFFFCSRLGTNLVFYSPWLGFRWDMVSWCEWGQTKDGWLLGFLNWTDSVSLFSLVSSVRKVWISGSNKMRTTIPLSERGVKWRTLSFCLSFLSFPFCRSLRLVHFRYHIPGPDDGILLKQSIVMVY